MSVKRSWLLLAGHPFFLVILCQCKLKKCEHGGGWERTDKKIITQCKDKKCGDEKDKIYFFFEKKTAVCPTIISYKLKTTANNTLRSCLAFAIADYDTFILSAGIYQFCFFLFVKKEGEDVPFFFVLFENFGTIWNFCSISNPVVFKFGV